MKKIIIIITSMLLTGCVVVDDQLYRDPIYHPQVIIYDVWPQQQPFYHFTNVNYYSTPPVRYGPRKKTIYNRNPRHKQKGKRKSVRKPR